MTTPPSIPDRVELQIDELARKMVSSFVAAVPAYGRLPREQLDGEIHAICAANLRLLMRCLREHRGPDAAELAEPRASAARRAEERVALDQVLTAYMTGARIGWDALSREAAPDEMAELLRYVPLVLTYLRDVTAVVSEAYVQEQEALVGEERDARRDLTEALLTTGNAPAALADRAGVTPAETYRAVALRFASTPDESDPAVSTTVAVRRKIRRVVDALETLTGGPALTLLDASGGAAVLDLADPQAAHAVLTEAVGGDVWLNVSDAVRPPALPTAWRQAREVRRLTTVLQRPAGVWTVEDVLLERTLSADPVAAERLVSVLAPLEEREDLMLTVEVWFEVDFDRREAAARLMIHPNTLDYRLRRVSELVGRDLTTAAGTQLIGAALLARRLGTGG